MVDDSGATLKPPPSLAGASVELGPAEAWHLAGLVRRTGGEGIAEADTLLRRVAGYDS